MESAAIFGKFLKQRRVDCTGSNSSTSILTNTTRLICVLLQYTFRKQKVKDPRIQAFSAKFLHPNEKYAASY